ncbi:MAG: arsenic efflux protein [Eubacterium sp.]|nr:arsenic efflux protein [Eubacterium sp.]
MIEFLIDIILDGFLDTIKLIPFLLITYLAMEWLEHKTGSKTQAVIHKAGKAGPLLGGILGVFPQCGFSAAAANLYAGGLITAGTLVAVFLSTSDEMLPIFISSSVPVVTIVKILLTKMVLGIVTGFVMDFIYHGIFNWELRYKNIHTMCENEHCGCDEGILVSSLRHTLHIVLFIFVISVILNGVIEGVGTENIAALVLNMPVVGQLIAGVIGMIPNCAASVVITQLYLEGMIGAGAMMTGLLAGAGVGILLLCRMNKKHPKQNAGILLFVYVTSVIWGILIDAFHIAF